MTKKKKSYYYVCLNCGKTVTFINKDGECMRCADRSIVSPKKKLKKVL